MKDVNAAGAAGRDRHGLETTGGGADTEAGEHYAHAVDSLLFFRGDVADAVEAMREAAPRAPLAHAFAAYLGLLGTEADQAAVARERFARFRESVDQSGFTARERAHLQAASVWLAGDIERAGTLLRELSVSWPRDALALAVGHQIDFFTGNAASLRDRIAGALSAWDEDDPHYGPLLGMFAFGLEESGHYARAEQVGLAAVARNARDVWGIHAVVHALEMQGRFAEGIGYLDARREHWGAGNMMAVHNWWHYALYALEAGDTGRALQIYDATLHHAGSEGLALELLDASALLWRLLLDGPTTAGAVGGRWEALADAWAARDDGPHYAFNDTHAVMAYLGAGRMREAEALVADRAEWAARPHPGVTNHTMTAQVGLPVCRALIAFAQERYGHTVDLLAPQRNRLQTFGGSHAQRDAVQRTLIEAALRAGRYELARTLLSERLNLRPSSPYNWLGQARLADELGQAALAATARDRAAALAAPGMSALNG
ncbi:tetratricopeptide repeat protein [Streptomyces iconiensis]|uniref:Tetratricopeptide repeat protein 38 n=1 Tax=Streptomyces iconiensis TaxID=1384038 RepID=A0ABT6ZYJ6_9ACTN|nr:tetratricopeptide repeat protein [Streptomyces iconiensis]MDJ1133917.1 tetratricopeptide repeat protein [Streptomyces iconiensis]